MRKNSSIANRLVDAGSNGALYHTRMNTTHKSIIVSVLLWAASSICTVAQETHGPICLWHLDPTTTMNIQWIEEVNASVEDSKWFVGNAGFGYGDDDDATRLDMERKHQVLYIRKEFNLRALPTERPVTIFGGWKATAKRERGEAIEHEFTIAYDFRGRKSTGELTQGEGEADSFSKLDVAGSSVEFEYELEIDKEVRTVRVTGKVSGEENDKLNGKWQAVDANGTSIESGEWSAELTERPRFGGRRRGGRGGGRGGGSANLKLVLRIRYDDGFICFLNGEEIVRANVESGSGSDARGIAGHDADDEEEFVVDAKALVGLLKRGRNVISIEGHNNALDSSDFTLDPEFGYEAFGRYQVAVDDGEEWQYLLGQPQEDWKTAEVEASRVDDFPSNTSNYVVRYGKRGQSMSDSMQTARRHFADTGNVIHQALLTKLEPDTAYAFELHRPGVTNQFAKRYFFRTAPDHAAAPLKFVVGGDMYGTRAKLDAMNSEAGRQGAAFALLGGDLAYANGSTANRWYDWVDSWARFAITPEDYCVPMIVLIGNHECDRNLNEVAERDRGDYEPQKRAKFYYSLFPLPENMSNFVMDFGDYMSIVCLDSYHTQTPESQVTWLEETLRERAALPNLFACYHRPAYGALVKEDIEDIRKYWCPLFEKYGVDVVFENDHHMYKRTLPLVGGKMHPDGVAYLGDGAWGVEPREIPWERTRRLGYVVRGESQNHLIRVTIDNGYQMFDAYTSNGIPIDNYVRFYARPSVLTKTSQTATAD